MTTVDLSNRHLARTYARLGFYVLPIESDSKKPLTRLVPNGVKDATNELSVISAWWREYPDANIAVRCGESAGIVAFDIDPRNGGDESWAQLVSKHGEPKTLTARSGGGGRHFFFKWKPGLPSTLGAGIDVKSPTDGYVLVAPSTHPSGGRYQWRRFLDVDAIGELPAWVEQTTRERKAQALPRRIPDGERNLALVSEATRLFHEGRSESERLALLMAINEERCQPPLERSVVEDIAECKWISDGPLSMIEKPTPPDIGRALRGVHPIAVLGGAGGQLAVYRDGVYRLGEAAIRQSAADILGKRWTPTRVDSSLKWLADSSETPTLWGSPPLDRINLLNGIFDLKSSKLKAHSPDFLSLVQLPVTYEPRAECPTVESFVEQALPPDLVLLFYEVAGWLMVPDITRKTAVLFWGQTDTGKSTAIDLLQAFLGASNYSSVSLQDLGGRFRPAELVGKLANFFDDLPNTTVRDTGNFKVLTGRGVLTVERKFGHPYQVQPFARLVFATNEAPGTGDTSNAYFNRWLILPFENRVPKAKQDRQLSAKLTRPEELSGLFNLALEALARGSFSDSVTAEKASRDFREKADPVSSFIAERYVFDPNSSVRKRDLAVAYKSWCLQNRRAVPSTRQLNDHLRGLDEWRSRAVRESTIDGWPCWRGLRRREVKERE